MSVKVRASCGGPSRQAFNSTSSVSSDMALSLRVRALRMQGIKGQHMDTVALWSALRASTLDRLLERDSYLVAFDRQFGHPQVLEHLLERNRKSVVNRGKMFSRGRPPLFKPFKYSVSWRTRQRCAFPLQITQNPHPSPIEYLQRLRALHPISSATALNLDRTI